MMLVFWIACALVAYVYVGYPVLLVAWARWTQRKGALPGVGPFTPSVSIVIAARNEARLLPDRIANLRVLDYPESAREIIVVSDGSTDDTLDVLSGFPDVVVVAVEGGGKARALNAGVARTHHDVLVFADARQTFADDALKELVAPLQDPDVGGVTGQLLLDSEIRSGSDSAVGEGVGMYWRYEKRMRRAESAVDSTLGATGAIYALRRSLWRPLPAGTILDDVLAPMRAVLAGSRVVFNDRARAFDRASAHAADEARRKTRTLAGNFQLLWLEPDLLLPWRNRVWLQFVSHKLGRLIVPYALIALVIASAALARESIVYAVALSAQIAFCTLAAYGAASRRGSMKPLTSVTRAARIAFTFLVLNYSAVAGLVALATRRRVWR